MQGWTWRVLQKKWTEGYTVWESCFDGESFGGFAYFGICVLDEWETTPTPSIGSPSRACALSPFACPPLTICSTVELRKLKATTLVASGLAAKQHEQLGLRCQATCSEFSITTHPVQLVPQQTYNAQVTCDAQGNS